MRAENKAIWLGPDNTLHARTITEQYEPQGNQGLVQIVYSGINPADVKHGKHMGLNDYVCGYEFSGKVAKAGSGFPYAVGDEIYGSKRIGMPSAFAAHQDWALAEDNSLMAKRPSTLPMEAAASMPIVVRTAADALFNIFRIPFKPIGFEGKPMKGGILIWGGASSVGNAAIQLAKAAGVRPIITTASAKNHQSLTELGATHCVDYRSEDAVVQVQKIVDDSEEPIMYVFDAVSTPGPGSSLSNCDALRIAPGTLYCATITAPATSHKWLMCLATRASDLNLPPPMGAVPADAEAERRLVETVNWVAKSYGKVFRIPNIRVVEGIDAAMEAIQLSADGKLGYEKVVIRHPF